MFDRKIKLIKLNLILGVALLIFFMLMACSQMENQSNKTNINPINTISNINVPLDKSEEDKPAEEDRSAIEILNDLASKKFTINGDQLSEDDREIILDFGKAFVNLYTGAVAEQQTVSFENYISNENLLKFTNKMLELEQKQELKGGIGVIFGLENEFKEAELEKIDENLYYLDLNFLNQGSGMRCRLLIQSENGSLKIADLYFGNMDGVDTIVTGHHTVRKLDNPELWNDQEWVDSVFEKLKEYESKQNSLN